MRANQGSMFTRRRPRHGGGGTGGFRGRVLQAGQQGQDPGMKAAPFLGQGHRARRAIEQPHADPGLEPRHGPAHP